MTRKLCGTPAQFHKEMREEQRETIAQRTLAVRGLVRLAVGAYQKSLRTKITYQYTARSKQNNTTTGIFNAPLGDFKVQFLDDRGSAPRDVHLRHRHRPYYAGASLPLGQRATLQERPHLLAITWVKRQPHPLG